MSFFNFVSAPGANKRKYGRSNLAKRIRENGGKWGRMRENERKSKKIRENQRKSEKIGENFEK